MPEKRLLSVKEFMNYTGMGMTKARELIAKNNFSVKIGRKIYVDRVAFDSYLNDCRERGVALI